MELPLGRLGYFVDRNKADLRDEKAADPMLKILSDDYYNDLREWLLENKPYERPEIQTPDATASPEPSGGPLRIDHKFVTVRP